MSAYGFGGMIQKLKKNPKTIVFTEGTDARILEAASRLLAGTFLTPILVGNKDEIYAAAEEEGYNIRGAQIIDPNDYDRFEEMVDVFCELRKSKGMTPEKARPILAQPNYFGTMLVKMGIADCLLGGATYSTADTVRPALQIIKTKPGNSIVSSCFILVRAAATGGREVIAMGDCAININPSEDDLVEICGETAECARVFGIDPKVAFLSFSTAGSAKDPSVTKVQNSRRCPDLRSQVMPTHLSSLISTQETLATRSLSVWVSSRPMAPSFWVSTHRSTTSPAAATRSRFIPWRSSQLHFPKRSAQCCGRKNAA